MGMVDASKCFCFIFLMIWQKTFVTSSLFALFSLLKDKSLCYCISVLSSKRKGKRQSQPPKSAVEPDKA